MQVRCPHCLVSYDQDNESSWSSIVCPSCGGTFCLSGVETTCTYGPGMRVLGRFELLEEVGSGRFGTVWKARDTELKRTVAVKVPRQRELNAKAAVAFLRDARSAAQLRHPRIAQVHEVGREDDTVYVVTDFIDGANLHEWLSGQQITGDEAATVMVKIAEAVHHAHEMGVVHRDLKPSNIMMDREGEPYVIDFGLARREIGDMTVTIEGQVLGTPSYMSPEQARGEAHQADRRSDIYSLGVILFKLLTGELPFRGEIRMLIMQILEAEPPNPRTLNASIPRDLATITLKCLEKVPAKRYQTSQELADDLRRYLSGEPIKARAVSPFERVWRSCKRRPEVASLAALLLLLLLAAAIVSPIVAVHQARLRREAELQVANNLFQRAAAEYDEGRVMQGITLLTGALEVANSESALSGSIRNLLPAWESGSWHPVVQNHAVLSVSFSPDGRLMLIAGHDPRCPARFWDVKKLVPVGEPLRHENSVRAAAFAHHENLAMTASMDGTARLWDVPSGKSLGKPLQHQGEIWAIAISSDDKIIVTGGSDETARLWDSHTGDSLGDIPHDSHILAVAFHPERNNVVLTATSSGEVKLWDVSSKQPLGDGNQVILPNGEGAPIYGVAFSPDGKRIAAAVVDGTVRIWDTETFEPLCEPLRHSESNTPEQSVVYAVAFSQDGTRLISGSFDQTARLWDVREQQPQPIGEPMRHAGWVMSVAFDPAGHTVLTGGADRTVRMWQLHDGVPLPHEGMVLAAAFSPDGRLVTTGGEDKTIRLWDVATTVSIGKPLQHESSVLAVAFSADGRKVFSGTSDQRLRCWDVPTGEQLMAGHEWNARGVPSEIRPGPDGKSVVVLCTNHEVELWGIEDDVPVLTSRLQFDDSQTVVACSPSADTLLVRENDRQTARLWNVQTARPVGVPLSLKDTKTLDAKFSDDGRIVTGAWDQRVRLWNAETGAAIGAPWSHDGVVNVVAFGQDDRTILSGGADRTGRLWDATLGTALCQPLQHPSPVTNVALGPSQNGRCRLALTVCGSDGAARLWDVRSGTLLARPLQYDVAVEQGTFNGDGSMVLFKCRDATVRLYRVPQPIVVPRALIRSWAQARTGFELDHQGALRQLSQDKWLAARTKWTQAQHRIPTLRPEP